jgi:hypothetical protein
MSKVRKNTEPRGARSRAVGLTELLRVLPEKEIASIVDRLGIHVDPAKRIDVPSQVARSLVSTPELRDLAHFPGPTRERVHRIAEAKACFPWHRCHLLSSARCARHRVRAWSAMASSSFCRLRSFFSCVRGRRRPRGVRAALADVERGRRDDRGALPGSPGARRRLCSGSKRHGPLSPTRRASRKRSKARSARAQAATSGRTSAEVDTEELLDLGREPMRLRGATGATPSRRGVGRARAARVPHPHPPEPSSFRARVSSIISRAAAKSEKRGAARSARSYSREIRAPCARFAQDPSVLAFLPWRSRSQPSGARGVGTPRSFVSKLAARFGRESEAVALVAWRSAADRPVGSVGRCTQFAAGFGAGRGSRRRPVPRMAPWRRLGRGASRWGNVPASAAGTGRRAVVGVVREMVSSSAELGEGRWVPWEVAGFVPHR